MLISTLQITMELTKTAMVFCRSGKKAAAIKEPNGMPNKTGVSTARPQKPYLFLYFTILRFRGVNIRFRFGGKISK